LPCSAFPRFDIEELLDFFSLRGAWGCGARERGLWGGGYLPIVSLFCGAMSYSTCIIRLTEPSLASKSTGRSANSLAFVPGALVYFGRTHMLFGFLTIVLMLFMIFGGRH